MTNSTLQTEGIVLQSVNFKENDRIVTVFTLNSGLVKLYIKSRAKTAFIEQALSSPLTRAEYLYLPGRNDFFFFKEGSLIDQYSTLRSSLNYLEAAQKLSQALLRSQWQGKPAPQLYTLLCIFLEQIPTAPYIETLIASFLVKILKHEGLLASEFCSICHTPLQACFRFGGECFCKTHSLSHHFSFSWEEERLFTFLSHCRSFKDLSSLNLPEGFLDVIEVLFEQAYQN